MKLRRIPLLLYLLAVVGFGIFGAVHRQSYPDITTQPDYLNQLSVAVLPDEACAMASQDMLERFPQTPIIARVTPISDLIPLFYVNQQKFRVQQVFSGEELSVGEEIWITDPSWCVLVDDVYRHFEGGYVAPPKQGQEYLVFLSRKLEVVDGWSDTPVYQLSGQGMISPLFCYQDLDTHVDTVPSGLLDSSVPFSEMSQCEFMTATQTGMDILMEAKHALLAQYPCEFLKYDNGTP
ncbi:hypothetical protein H9X86_07545 [Pseudoflavonifractor capillosus]|uniref:hypothetical protein n=1 Tax=Pseudoflavonifractor capillosus TaxID=106588 RepID=UPI00195B61C7|nr:hypothetical protein [Pseudoflavonifractor capillosus]MBM6897223.1 hypothetical protein [Pseudoflavonifractor capillosus]